MSLIFSERCYQTVNLLFDIVEGGPGCELGQMDNLVGEVRDSNWNIRNGEVSQEFKIVPVELIVNPAI